AEIAAVHSTAEDSSATDWDTIVETYGRLMELKPSPVIYLNLAAAVAMRDGPSAGLELMDDVAAPLDNYQPFHASRAELLLRAGHPVEAEAGFDRALEFPLNEVERAHLERRRDATRSMNDGSG